MDCGPGGRNKALAGGGAEAPKAREEVVLMVRKGAGPFAQGPDVGFAAEDAGNDDLVLCQRKWHFPGLHRSG